MNLLTQTEVASMLQVTKQYIHYLIKSGKINKYDDSPAGFTKRDYVRVDLDEVRNFLNKDKTQKDTMSYELYDAVEEEFLKGVYFKEWNLKDIAQDDFISFIINNFYEFYTDYTETEIIENMMVIGSLIYNFQFSYESKPTKKTNKEFANQVTNDTSKVRNQAEKLIKSLHPDFASPIIKSLEELIAQPLRFIKHPEYVPEKQISKSELADHIKMITAPKGSLLLKSKKYNSELDNNEKYHHNYKIEKILKVLPFQPSNN